MSSDDIMSSDDTMSSDNLWENVNVGHRASLTRRVTMEDIRAFAQATGDLNPVHIDPVYAEGTKFKGIIAHGMLAAGLISAVLGTELPGPGCIYLGQDLRFLRPVRPGDTITAEVEVWEVDRNKNRATLRTTCTNQHQEIVVDGQARVMLPKSQS